MCDSGIGAAGGADDGAAYAGGLPDAEAAAARLNSAGRSPGNWGPPSFFSQRAHLLTTPKGRWYCLRQPCALRGGCGSCGSLMSNATSHLCCCHWPRSRLYVLLHHQNCCFRFGNNPPPARIKLPPAALFAVMGIACRNTHFLFAKKKQKQGRKDGENEWRFTT